MLKESENEEIREHLIKAQNPLFYFDNDPDGLCSYLLLRRYYNKGNGVPVKTSYLGKEYLRRIDEFNPDYIFILDKPNVSEEFFDEVRERNLPIVWIDHHNIDKSSIPEWVNYHNPLFSSGKEEPVTKLCYDVVKKKEDLWIMVAGCIADKYFPKGYEEFLKKYPDLGIDSKVPFDILYHSQIGKISLMVGYGLNDRTSFVMKMIRFLINVRTPYEVLEEKADNREMHKRFEEVDSKLKILIKKAEENTSGEMIFFRYDSNISVSGIVANKLSYDFPDKIIIVAKKKGVLANLSMRGVGIRDKFLEAIKEIPGARGGGHENAIGGQIDFDKLDVLEENLNKLLNQKF